MDAPEENPLPDLDGIAGAGFATLDQLSRHLQEGLFILDTRGRLAYLNPAGERILGWKHDTLLGAPMHDRIHFQNPMGVPIPAEECPVHKSVVNGQTYRAEEEAFIHRDGHLVPVSFVSSPLRQGERITGSVTVFKEIGQRREMEREIKQARDIALETARLKSEFLANMSHEIRTPINGVIGLTGLLVDSKLNKEQRELAATARESAQALLTVVDDILDFAGLEAGKMEIFAADFKTKLLVAEVAELHASQAQNKGLTLHTSVSNKLPSVLQGDPARLRQVLLNLVSNAIKFTRKGDVSIRARLMEKSKTRVLVRFTVLDTGIGIPKSSRHRLFQPFTQVDGSSSRAYGGAGLGLSISKRLVELMGGEMGYESRKGKGSAFWFTVPLNRSGDEETDLEPAQPREMSRLRGVKALVVDPQQTSRTILLNSLLHWNLKGTAVESAGEALAYLRHESNTPHPCDLVLIASSLENEEADFTLARAISESALAPASLVLLTGDVSRKHLERARNAGYVAHLAIPLQLDRLRECLLSLFNPPDDQYSLLASSVASPSARPGNRFPEGGAPILLAEDNAVIQKVEQMLLNRLGYAVHLVANGKDACQHLLSHDCSLVLMDCQMPVMDGFLATQAIRAFDGAAREIPIIGLTANPRDEGPRCLESGMTDILAKPVQIESLAEMLKKWLPVRRDEAAGDMEGAGGPLEQPPIRLDGVTAHFGDERAVILEFMETFAASAAALLARIREGIERQERAAVAEAAHELKGSSDNMGAIPLAALTRRLESALEVGDWEMGAATLQDMELELARCQSFIESYKP